MKSGGGMNTDKMRKMSGTIRILAIAVVLVFAVFLGRQVFSGFTPSDRIPADAKSDFGLMAEAWNAIQAHYVDRSSVKPVPMTYGAISGMVAALGDDDHSTFLTPEMLKKENEYTQGQYKGIGAEVKMKNGQVTVVTPIDGSPAQKAGLKPGEVILAVDGQNVSGLKLIQVVKRIAGPEGTEVTLSILDPVTGKTRKVTLVRAEITVDNVSLQRLPGTRIDHLRIAGFSENVTKNLKTALMKLKSDDSAGIILDLRNNPGGLLEKAVSVASQFLAGGNVLLEKNARGKIKKVPVEKGGAALHIPMVALVNGGTASAAEIVAGALQDHGRAELVGTKTFGTGTVLREFPLSDGSVMLLAVEEWLTPDGRTIWHKGIEPNRVIDLPEGTAPLFPMEERNMTPQQLEQSKDRQLLYALGLLTEKQGR